MQEIQWYKINLPVTESISKINRFKAILDCIDSVKNSGVACYTKVANNGSCDVFLTDEIIKHLELDLQKYNPVKCSPPQNKRSKEGFLLTYIFGNQNIIK